MPLLTNGDFKYAPILNKFQWILGSGLYVDFNKDWYINAAPQLIITMTITAFLPWVELCVFYLLSRGKICFDRFKARQTRKDLYNDKEEIEHEEKMTMANSVSSYIQLYAGPKYLMHFKFSSILC
jgi:hypothetical protein